VLQYHIKQYVDLNINISFYAMFP